MSIEVADQLNQESAMEKNDEEMSAQQDNASKTLLSQSKQRSLNAEQDANNTTGVMSKISQ